MKSNSVPNKIEGINNLVAFLPVEEIDPKTITQLINTASMNFVKGVAVMPDCHLGRGSTVGSVIATQGAIMPAAVGVDIGCGMIAVETTKTANDLPDSMDDVLLGIERRIPTGFAGNKTISTSAGRRLKSLSLHSDYLTSVNARWTEQLGSLGGGNHFIELCLDERDVVWVVLHSGSRGIGNKLAQRHIKTAQKLVDQWHIGLPDRDLAYICEGVPEFKGYIDDLLWAQEYALQNREEMMDRVLTELSYLWFRGPTHVQALTKQRINCHHNFTQKEHHHGKNLWITRKGAIQMRQGQLGVIPGSMGTESYIVSGKGNPAAYESAPHGAGRRMSRTQARKQFDMEELEEEMAGITARLRPSLLDEHPGSYKDINAVMKNSESLVTIEHTLKQVLNVKGD